MSSRGIDAQSTTTNGPRARGLAVWSASAIASLPVPVSPSSITVASVTDTRARRANSFFIGGAAPMTRPKASPA